MGVFSSAIRGLIAAGASPEVIIATVEDMEATCLRVAIAREPGERKAPEKPAYTPEFEAFWRGYPEREGMSKKEAFDVWRRLPEVERQEATKALPAYRAYVEGQRKKRPDFPVVHACRFLSKRRAEALLEGQTASVPEHERPVFVHQDDARYRDLAARYRAEKGKPPALVNFGSYFNRDWVGVTA